MTYKCIVQYLQDQKVTSVKNNCIKLKGKVGMVVPKSTQTKVVGIIAIPTLAFQVTSDLSCNTTKVSLQGINIDEHNYFKLVP